MKTVLFDMDGTLTPPREKIERSMINALGLLLNSSKIGIVTGSDMNYLLEQCSSLFDIGGINPEKVRLYPCNGTKEYRWDNNNWKLVSSVNMVETLGPDCYRELLQELTKKQLHLLDTEGGVKYSGTFFQYRDSMLNWCPIGRSANNHDRKLWEAADLNNRIRNPILNSLKSWIEDKGYSVSIALGGGTSFDIYPSGWDKTYVYNHIDISDCYFVGDRCTGPGNDRQIYEKTKKDGLGAFSVACPNETLHIIKNIIIPELGEKQNG
tara:strand:- start:1194 stop:1991 length:798 start_codon:yes stop_codon:yes gene_type:complete